jgi:chromate transport protein ChrA
VEIDPRFFFAYSAIGLVCFITAVAFVSEETVEDFAWYDWCAVLVISVLFWPIVFCDILLRGSNGDC